MTQGTRHVLDRLAYLILDVDVEGAEVIAVLAMAFWGVILSLPLHTFASDPAYRQMASLAPQWGWAMAADMLALWQIAALLMHSPRGRRRGLLVAAGWWMGVAVLLFRTASHGMGWTLCGILCGACAWGYWRIRREERLLALATVGTVGVTRLSGLNCLHALKCWQLLALATRLWPLAQERAQRRAQDANVPAPAGEEQHRD